MFNRFITERFLKTLTKTEYGHISVETPDARRHEFTGRHDGAHTHLIMKDWRMIGALLRSGDVGLAETYRNGLWDCDDLAQFFLFGLQNRAIFNAYIYGHALGQIVSRLSYLMTRNTIGGSKKNIHAHYDLGNAFYALWLDPSMTYSSALFANENEPLQAAQQNKYDRILDHIGSSGSLLEIGCGWGGFAERALQKGDYAIKALTISPAQHDFATQRLNQQAKVALEDYRHQSNLYDNIVSIEMFEAVGEAYWPTYFSKLKSLLAPQGTAMVQTITIADPYFESYRRSGDAIRTYIFPGGMLPSPHQFTLHSQRAGLKSGDVFSFGPHYARTLDHWLKNFDARLDDIRRMGFDDRFIRLWRFYLSYCQAAFQQGHIDVMQWELQHAA